MNKIIMHKHNRFQNKHIAKLAHITRTSRASLGVDQSLEFFEVFCFSLFIIFRILLALQ